MQIRRSAALLVARRAAPPKCDAGIDLHGFGEAVQAGLPMFACPARANSTS